jgi:hypothetical protein
MQPVPILKTGWRGQFRRQRGRMRSIRLVLGTVVFLSGAWVLSKHYPRPALRTDADFRRYRDQLETLVALARAEQFPPADGNRHLRQLPAEYRHLSDGGEIVVEKPAGNTKVLFFTCRGLLSGSSGFLYTADDQVSMYEFRKFGPTEKKAPHWYRVVIPE